MQGKLCGQGFDYLYELLLWPVLIFFIIGKKNIDLIRIEFREKIACGSYRGIPGFFHIEERARVNEHQRATNEASDGPRPPQGAAHRLFLSAPPKRLSLMGCLGWLAQSRSPTQAATTGIQRSNF